MDHSRPTLDGTELAQRFSLDSRWTGSAATTAVIEDHPRDATGTETVESETVEHQSGEEGGAKTWFETFSRLFCAPIIVQGESSVVLTGPLYYG